jgi:hypothetical protein
LNLIGIHFLSATTSESPIPGTTATTMVPKPTTTMNQQTIMTTQPSMSQDTDVTTVQDVSCDIDGWVVIMVCWFMVVVGFGTIIVVVVPELGDSEVIAEKYKFWSGVYIMRKVWYHQIWIQN